MRLVTLQILAISLLIFSCAESPTKNESTMDDPATTKVTAATPITIDLAAANNLIQLPLACVMQEYPNKLGQVVGGPEDLRSPISMLKTSSKNSSILKGSTTSHTSGHTDGHGYSNLPKNCTNGKTLSLEN